MKENLEDNELDYEIDNPDFQTLFTAAIVTCDAQFDLKEVQNDKDIDYQTCPI